MGTNEYDKRRALFLAAVCRQAYTQFDNADGTFRVPGGYKPAGAFEARFTNGKRERFGFILESDNNAIVAFRGTVSFEDWIADAVARQKKYPYMRDAGWTHEGFTDLYDTVRKAIHSTLKKIPAHKKLHVAGHSLGGALATVCALDMAANTKFQPPLVYTFGSPRVGDPTFAKAYDSAIGGSHRVFNLFDVVPQIPPLMYKSPVTGAVYQYVHVKEGYRLQFRNGLVSGNHVIGSYLTELAKQDPMYAKELGGQNPGFLALPE